MSAGPWIAGLGASAAIHVAVAGVAPFFWQPQQVENQPRPQTQVQIETQEVARSRAEAREPDSEAAEQGSASGAQLGQEAIPQSRATPDQLPRESLAPSTPDAMAAAASPPQADALDAAPPQTQAITPTTANTDAITGVAPPTQPLDAAPPSTTAVAAAAPVTTTAAAAIAPATALAASVAPAPMATTAMAPHSDALAASTTAAPAAATIAAPTETVAPATATPIAANQSAPPSETLAPTAPPAERFTAALAWSGDDNAQLDAQSLEAIQSFMQEGDLSARSGEVRDAMSALLGAVPCSRLQAEFNPDTGQIDLRGHVPEDGLRAPVLAALQAQVGSGIQVNDAMLILPRPQCGALSGISGVGLPQSTDQLTDSRVIGEDAHVRAYDYTAGDRLIFDMAAPDYDAYIYVDFFDAGGQVIHLIPNEVVPLRLHPMQSTMRVGVSENGQPALEVTIGPPYGQEIAAAFAASAPLYDEPRPMIEPADAYLEWLAERVAEARAADPDFKGEWVYFFVSTSAD